MQRNTLYIAMQCALPVALTTGLALLPSPVLAQDQDEQDAAELGRVQVTGSRISRADVEGALPVTVIDRETIELSGRTSVADLLRNTTFNSAGSFRPQSGSTAQSFAGLSLRGLGSQRTLLLMDGRRLPKAPNVGFAQDLNSIPLGIVERIEILSDGASAVYGTDAIGGVVNIVTRKDFTGAEFMYGFSEPEREGGATEEGSALLGMSGDRGRLIAGASYNHRDIVFQRDRIWSQIGASTFSNNFIDAGEPTPGTVYGYTWSFNNFLDNPTFGAVVPGDGCTGEGFSSDDGICFYDFTLQAADEAELGNESLFVRGDYEINRDWTTYLHAGVSRVESFGRYAPVPSSPWPGGAIFIDTDSPNHPANRFPDAGYDPDEPVFLQHRFAALGPRDDSSEANLYDIAIGFQGRLGTWDLDFGARQTESQYIELQRNYVVGSIAQELISDGTYDIYDPFATPDDVANSMIATVNRDANFRLREYYATVSADLFDIPAGPVGFAAGVEYREEEYFDIFDSLSEAGQIVGSSGNSAGGGREVSAAFVEALFPLLDDLELTIAGRYDDYSDYGSDFSPKVSLRYQPLDKLTLRGSWGQGFAAPTLDIITQQPAFGAASVTDEATCEAAGLGPDCGAPGSIQINSYSIANPNLESESSDQFSLGMAYEPFDWLNGSLDYYNIEVEDTITAFSAQQLINCLDGTSQNCPDGVAELPPGINPPDPSLGLGVARDPNTGGIVYAQTGFGNQGVIETDGFDLNLRTNFDFGGAGRLQNKLQVSYVNSFEVNGSENAGEAQFPEYRAVLANEYSLGDFAFAWNINYIDSQDSALSSNLDRIPSWTTHDLQANWYAPWNGRITLGVTNLGDKDPPLDPGETRGFNFSLYDGYGRVPYLRYTQNF